MSLDREKVSPDGDDRDEWTLFDFGIKELQNYTEIDVLGPNGVYVKLSCRPSTTLRMLKEDALFELKKLPLSRLLLPSDDYICLTVGKCGEIKELLDESKTIPFLKLFVPLIVLRKLEGCREGKVLFYKIGNLIGHPIPEIEKHLNHEDMVFRLELFHVTQKSLEIRRVSGCEHYAFVEESLHEGDEDIPLKLESKIKGSNLHVEVWYWSREDEIAGNDLNCVRASIRKVILVKPSDIIQQALLFFRERKNIQITESSSDFLLQIVGSKRYLSKDVFLTTYQHVREAFENYRCPKFLMRRRDLVISELPQPPPLVAPSWVESYEERIADDKARKKKCFCSWDCMDTLKFQLHSVSSTEIDSYDNIYLRAAIFVGMSLICVTESPLASSSCSFWSKCYVNFKLKICDIAQAAQLCLSVVGIKGRIREEHVGIGWANTRLFNWKNELIQGRYSLEMHPYPKNFHDLLYPQGSIDIENDRTLGSIQLEFFDFEKVIRFPSNDEIDAYIRIMDDRKIEISLDESVLKSNNQKLQEIEKIESMEGQNLNNEQLELLWTTREYIAKYKPNLLPYLAGSPIIWSSRSLIARFYDVLKRWETISPAISLELLDLKYPDYRLREFAVKRLDENLPGDRIRSFINPLIQGLKSEPFGKSALAEMLLRRSLCNIRVAYIFFWLLRSELGQITLGFREGSFSLPKLYKRFALLIEAFCWGMSAHLDLMMKQVSVLSWFVEVTLYIKRHHKDKESATKYFRMVLEENADKIQNFPSPLEPTIIVGKLDVSSCRVLGSAKQPLLLCWYNAEPLARVLDDNKYQIIFKNGDDLRQDMLTLHTMTIMDALWKKNDMEFSMNLYPVLPMGKSVGVITVVPNSRTLFQIQCERVQKGMNLNMEIEVLDEWIRERAHDSNRYLEYVDRFAASCAGYCVATFVLGVKDRHQDNIMLTGDGRLFHIDFGHFLNHCKKKFGITRDRVPFVLTDHFLYVVGKGSQTFREGADYIRFKRMCLDAYLVLYDRRRLFVSMFTMLLRMGLPDLKNEDDLEALRSALCYGVKREDAIKFFEQTFEEAISGSWTTRTNWFFHSVKHI